MSHQSVEGVLEATVSAIHLTAHSGLFPSFASPEDALLVADELVTHLRAQGRAASPWHVVPGLQVALEHWAAKKCTPLPPGLLLVAQSVAIRYINMEHSGEQVEAPRQAVSSGKDVTACRSNSPWVGRDVGVTADADCRILRITSSACKYSCVKHWYHNPLLRR